MNFLKENFEISSMGKYFDRLMEDLRKKEIPYACLYLKAEDKKNSQQQFTNRAKHKLIQDLQDIITSLKASLEEVIPFFIYL